MCGAVGPQVLKVTGYTWRVLVIRLFGCTRFLSGGYKHTRLLTNKVLVVRR